MDNNEEISTYRSLDDERFREGTSPDASRGSLTAYPDDHAVGPVSETGGSSSFSSTQEGSRNRTKKKFNRQAGPLVLTPDPAFLPMLRQKVLTPLSPFSQNMDVKHVGKLLASLLLFQVLAFLSALDAHEQCLVHEKYALLDLVDDDQFQQNYDSDENDFYNCREIFIWVIVPTLVATTLLTGTGLIMVYKDTPPTQLKSLAFKLSGLALILFAVQSYNISSIMLWPKKNDTNNPYSSLAAVDVKGNISDNANLFYTTWFSQIISLVFLYQIVSLYVRLRKTSTTGESLLPSATWQSPYDHNARAIWYQSLYKLRIRTGFWFAAMCCSSIIVASSQYIWAQVETEGSYFSAFWGTSHVCQSAQYPLLCKLTFFSWFSGLLSAILCASALILHWMSKRYSISEDHHHGLLENLWQHRLPLWIELALSGILSVLLGAHAVAATSVVGPAARVGTLYYAAHFAFLLCLRICLGCVEEMFGIHSTTTRSKITSTYDENYTNDENERAEFLRRYFFLSIFSFVCAASAYDAAVHQNLKFTGAQIYMFYAPCWISLSSSILFFVALSRGCYPIVASFCVGGAASIVNFLVCFVDIVLTMHSEDSWAVNNVGEVLNGNLYYFTWACIITAGLQMTSYVTKVFGVSEKDFMTVLWSAICKLSFVTLGAAIHVWTVISDNCDFDEITSGAVTFCSRTVLANAVAITGLVVSGLVVTGRILLHICPALRCSRLQAHVEMLVSVFLLFVFGAAIAMVTSIGGPGQSVGDLYYSCTGAFLVSLVVAVSSYEHLQLEDHGLTSKDTTMNIQSQNSILV